MYFSTISASARLPGRICEPRIFLFPAERLRVTKRTFILVLRDLARGRTTSLVFRIMFLATGSRASVSESVQAPINLQGFLKPQMKFHLHRPDAVLHWQRSHSSGRKWDLADGLPYFEEGGGGRKKKEAGKWHSRAKTGSRKT